MDLRFGRIAVEQGYISEGQLQEALHEQERLRTEGEEIEVGQLLLRRNSLSTLQFLEVLAIQKSIPWICRKCELLFDTRELLEAPGRCPKCGGTLAVPLRR